MSGINQTDFWTGPFGDAYHARTKDELPSLVENRAAMWVKIWPLLPYTRLDILEVGAGMCANLEAIRRLTMNTDHPPTLFALEPNAAAREAIPLDMSVIFGTADKILTKKERFDLVFTYGVLIHLEDPLPAMREMFRVSRRFILSAEYFSPVRRRIPYRDDEQTGLPVYLAADDYGGLWMDKFDVRLVGYGFAWKRATGLDNVTWTLLEKRAFKLPWSRAAEC